MEQEKIKEMNEERMRLFTNFSHELRTPLTLISNPLEDLIQNNAFHPKLRVLDLMQKIRKRCSYSSITLWTSKNTMHTK